MGWGEDWDFVLAGCLAGFRSWVGREGALEGCVEGGEMGSLEGWFPFLAAFLARRRACFSS